MGRLLASITIILGITVLAGGSALAAASAPEVRARRTATQVQTSHRDPLPVPAAEARVVLYGDSLAAESADLFREALAAAGVADVQVKTFGGTAICDWLDRMQTDATVLAPTAVVVEFSGNALTPCMTDARGRSLVDDPVAYHDKYRTDAQAVLDVFGATGTRGLLRRCADHPHGRRVGSGRGDLAQRAVRIAGRRQRGPGPLRRRRCRDAPSEPVDTDPALSPRRALHRRTRRIRHAGQRRAGPRRRALLPGCTRRHPRRDRDLPRVVQRRVPLRQRHGRPRGTRPDHRGVNR